MQSDTPLVVLQELGGWESAEMVWRYAYLSTDDLITPYAEHLGVVRSGALAVDGTHPSQA